MTSLLSKTLKLSCLSLRLSPRSTLPSPSLLSRFAYSPARAMSSESTQRMFQLKLDPLTGNSEWVVIEEQSDDCGEASGNPRNGLLATTSYLDMLNDSARNRGYRQAIEKSITKPCHVLDIGAGTGLLSMMAARAMGSNSTGMVTACESYLPMLKLLKKVLHRNSVGRNIKVINKRSDEVKVGVDIAGRADVLVSEILDSELLGEGLIPTLQHAHDMLLNETPITVPYRATTYGQLVESAFLWKLHDLSNNEAKALDNIHLVPAGLDHILRVKPQQYPLHCDALSKEIKLLSEPFKIFEFDFWKRPDSQGGSEVLIKPASDGRVHAVVSWWILQLDYEGTIFYTTAPRWVDLPTNISTGDWCDHWKQCVWFTPGEGIPVSSGEEVRLHAVHDSTNIMYNLTTQATEASQHDFNAGDFHLVLSPERIAIYGDNQWRSSMLTALSNVLQERVPSLCVVVDDSVFLALLVAHLSQTSRVISLFPGLWESGTRYLHAVADANGFSEDRIEVCQKRKHLTLDDTDQKKVDLLLGEPYYYGHDGMLPWQNLRFWKERTMLDSVLSEDVLIMPCKALLKAFIMSLPDLWNSRRCLNKVEGFDHSVVNTTLGACGELPAAHECPLLPFFIWQCGEIKELSKTFTIMEFDFSKPISPCFGNVQVEFTEAGICHGIVLWMDWVMDSENSVVVSTGPDTRFWKQGVKLLAEPVAVGIRGANARECSSAVIEASFDPLSGELSVKHTFESHYCGEDDDTNISGDKAGKVKSFLFPSNYIIP